MTDIKKEWEKKQNQLKLQLISSDYSNWISKDEPLKHIGGVDISFIKDDPDTACAAFVVLSYPELKVVYEKYEMVKLEGPYIPGFLAFREVKHLKKLVCEAPDSAKPQVIMVDGNGVLHPRGFGLASHLGVLTGIPTIGVGKKLFVMDGLEKELVRKAVKENKGSILDLKGRSGRILGFAYRFQKDGNPIYISIGHNVSLETCKDLINKVSKFRIPEPVRQADLRSREYIRNSYKPYCQDR